MQIFHASQRAFVSNETSSPPWLKTAFDKRHTESNPHCDFVDDFSADIRTGKLSHNDTRAAFHRNVFLGCA